MTQKTIRVLLVEDNPGDAYRIKELLAQTSQLALDAPEFELTAVNRLGDGVTCLATSDIDVVLLDLDLPDSWGLDTFVKVCTHAPNTPVIVLTGLSDESSGIKAVRAGAQDYLLKDEVTGSLLARALRYAIERQRVQEALQRERDFVAAILNTAGALVVVLNREGHIVRFNRACERTTGYTFDEVRGQCLWDLFLLPEDVEAVKARFNELREGNFPLAYENYWQSKDGSRRLIAWSNTALLDQSGVVEYVVSIGIDVEEERRRQHEATALAEMARRVGVSLRLEEVLELAVAYTQESFGVDYCLIALYDAEQERLRYLAEKGLPEEVWARLRVWDIAPSTIVREKVLQQGTPLSCDDVTLVQGISPQILALIEQLGVQRGLIVPLTVGKRVLGILALADRAGHQRSFGEQVVSLALALARQAALAIDNAQLYAKAQQVAVLEERQRLARDLHDSVTQSLYSLALLTEAGRRSASGGDLERVEGYLARLGEIAHQTLKEMRLLVYELRPIVLDKEGLLGALQQRLDAVEGRAGIEARLLVEAGESLQLPRPVEEALYFIALEALNNALKHASATSVTVRIRAEGPRIALDVLDNGVGFDPQVLPNTGGMGLVSMRERAEQLGGTLTIDSTLGAGTQVEACLEIRAEET